MAGNVSDGRLSRRRLAALQRLAIETGRREFEARHPGLVLSPVVALICAYEEEANLGRVLERMPAKACGLEVTPLVVVDGGEDRTDEVAMQAGAVTFVLPANLGHGVALRVGYDLCVRYGGRYVVTLDADGQDEPAELEDIVQPVVDGDADFVVASRRLGMDESVDRYRRLGVVFFSWMMNRLMGSRLTDTSNGFRALRAELLADVGPRLVQDQFQTAELLVTAMGRGWRVTERPTVRHERTSGASKKGSNFLYGFRYASVMLRTWRREARGTSARASS